MGAKNFAAEMKEIIVDLKEKGHNSIDSDTLIKYLSEVENSANSEPSAIEIEAFKANLQHKLEDIKFDSNTRIEMFKSVITSGQNAVKTGFLLNGGATLAMLTFIGHISERQPNRVSEFGCSMYSFTIGVLLVAITSGLTYLSQWFYSNDEDKSQTAGDISNYICIVLMIASYVMFFIGIIDIRNIFLNFNN